MVSSQNDVPLAFSKEDPPVRSVCGRSPQAAQCQFAAMKRASARTCPYATRYSARDNGPGVAVTALYAPGTERLLRGHSDVGEVEERLVEAQLVVQHMVAVEGWEVERGRRRE